MTPQGTFFKRNLGFLALVGALAALPFLVALLNGQTIPDLLDNQAG